MTVNTHAVGQLQGYLLQVRHALFELISGEGKTVSVECFDDVAIKFADDFVVAEQIKSVTSSNNPVSDRSVVFWKTLYNWLRYVQDGSLNINNTVFRLIIMSNKQLNLGDIIKLFHEASDKDQAIVALKSAKKTLWGEKGELKNGVPNTYKKYLNELFANNNEDTTLQLITKMYVVIHENDYDEKLRKKFNDQIILPEFADKLFEHMLGWITEKVNEYLKQGMPAIIQSEEYRSALIAQVRTYQQRNSIPALSKEIDVASARTEMEQQDVYIQQLDLIEVDYDEKLDAASDFLRTKAEIVERADRGLIVQQGLDEYNNKLKRTWKNKRQIALLAQLPSDIEKGKYLYAETNDSASKYNLHGSEVPSFFGSGILQMLANKPHPEPQIGWHPSYKDFLKKRSESNERLE